MAALRVDHEGAVVTLGIDDGRLNVLTLELVEELRRELARANARADVHVLVLRGRDGAFSAGLDTKALATGDAPARRLLASMGALLVDLYASRLRIVVGCSGHAVAAGAMLLLVSDARIAAAGDFRIGFSELAQGMPLPELPVLLARDRLNGAYLQACTVTGRLLAPGDAARAGFVDQVVPAEDLADVVSAVAGGLAGLDDEAYLETLTTVRGATLARMTAIVDAVRRSVD